MIGIGNYYGIGGVTSDAARAAAKGASSAAPLAALAVVAWLLLR